ncbi:hypothetical protein yinte0001_32470 [Yersinia intermedia ATCC 29909]|nr:hypothetical protein yinte0001_32470 [Yersinia intermedia ATCC 29909]
MAIYPLRANNTTHLGANCADLFYWGIINHTDKKAGALSVTKK